MRKILALCSVLIFTLPLMAAAQATTEHIISYKSDITVQQDRTLAVTEKIQVYADGTTIKHGIYRDFPTTYKDSLGTTHKVTFTLTGARMNGEPEPYHTDTLSNGIRIYVGAADTLLNPGTYNYEISYTVSRELGFFKDHDELYWNVTGNGWDYVIDSAQATVHLPPEIPLSAVTTNGYTGAFGSEGKDYTASTTVNGIVFSSSRKLAANEGLTLVVGWPKGYIASPTRTEEIINFIKDNWAISTAVSLAALIFIFYILVWWKHGRDPKKGIIIAQYEPPKGLSPGAIRYVMNEGYDTKILVASIISLAVQKCLRIEETKGLLGGKTYTLIRTGTNTGSIDEAAILSAIFGSSTTDFTPSRTNYEPLMAAKTEQTAVFKDAFGSTYFTANSKYVAGFLFFSIVPTFFLTSFLPGLTGVALIAFLAVVNIVFIFLLRRRTPAGRALEDQIEGFKLFLSVTEKDRMNFANPPQQTPDLFEKFLPYALALGVENKWAEQFASTFKALEQSGHAYTPIWYIGTNFSSGNIGGFTSALGGSFSSTISSSSTPPGSSSGGGGFSGGGGGGGGGGGW